MKIRRILHQIITLVKKDLLREWRTKEISISTLAFSIVLLFIFTFGFYSKNEGLDPRISKLLIANGFEPTVNGMTVIFPGILWVSIIFSATLAIGRSFAQEQEEGCLRAIALIPHAGISLYVAKLILNLIYIIGFEIFLVPLIAFIFDVPLSAHLFQYIGVIAAGTLGYAAIATLVSAMMVNSRLRDVMIPILLYPLIIPLLMGCLVVTKNIYLQTPDFSVSNYLRILFATDIVFLIVSGILFKWVLEAIE